MDIVKKALGFVLERLTSLYFWIDSSDNNLDKFTPLSPTDAAENVDDYLSAIEWALNKRDKIKNIAITGPYGSGKSSIIQTFQKRHQFNSKYKFLNISLATFKEEREQGPTSIDQNELLRLIELSILQQVFYHEKDTAIPDSRFSKIKKRNKVALTTYASMSMLAIVSFMNLFFSEKLKKIRVFNIPDSYKDNLDVLSSLILYGSAFFLIYQLIFLVKNIAIKKIGINNSEIEIDEKISKSILNKHLDEILYFFEVTGYNVVIIEDLDRFEQTEVFTKLREINLLLNNSKKISKKIVFLYAIKDEMFKNKDRAKFFDYIVPIIPVINSSNSNAKLIQIVKKNKYKVSNELVDDLALFIDDMRLLYNIMNEFKIYNDKIGEKLDQSKLLSIIVYKNMYPSDFSELGHNSGVLYQTLQKRSELVEVKTKEVTSSITSEKEILKRCEENKIKDMRDLRAIYLASIVDQIFIKYPSLPFRAFFISNNVRTISDIIDSNDLFNHLTTNLFNVEYIYSNHNGHRRKVGFQFSEIEDIVAEAISFKDREKLTITSNNKSIEAMRKKIRYLENERSSIKKLKLKDLIGKGEVTIDTGKDQGQGELLNILLRQGYIDEDYFDYISLFHEGDLTRADYDFLINIKRQAQNDFDYKLKKIENLVKKIPIFEYEKPFVLNFYLLDYLLKKSEKGEVVEKIFKQLSNESEVSIEFIQRYSEHTSEIEKFTLNLAKHWHNAWQVISTNAEFMEETREKFLKLFLSYADMEDLKNNFSGSISYLNERSDFLLLIEDEERLKEIIKALELKFCNVDQGSSQNLVDFIYDSNFYEINVENLKYFLTSKGNRDINEVNTANYEAIKNSSLVNLKEYVDNNFSLYVKNVYIEIDLNRSDPEGVILEFMQDDEISLDMKEDILNKVETCIDIWDKELELEVVNTIISCKKIKPSWKNVTQCFHLNGNAFTENLISYLNDEILIKELIKDKLLKDFPDEETGSKLIRCLFLDNSLVIDNYEIILKSNNYHFTSLNIESLDEDKARVLVKHQKLAVTVDNFISLKEYFPGLETKLLENDQKGFLGHLSDYDLTTQDVINLLKSTIVTNNSKNTLIKHFDIAFLQSDTDLVDEVAQLILDVSNIELSDDVIKMVIKTNKLDTDSRMKVFIKKNKVMLKEDIDDFFYQFDQPYGHIAENGKRPKLKKSALNEELAQLLSDRDYISSYKVDKIMGSIRIATKKK